MRSAVAKRLPLLALLVWAAPGAWAAERRIVRFQADIEEGVGCPSDKELRSLVAARLGYDPFSEQAASSAKASIHRHNGRLLGAVQLVDAQGAQVGARALEAANTACAALAESLALALAIAVDPALLARAAPPPEPAPVPVERIVVLPPEVLPAPAIPIAWSIHLGALLSTGALPPLALGLSFEWRLRREALSLAVQGALLPSATLEAVGGRIDTSVLRGGLQACGHLGPAGLCLRGGAGVLRASGEGFVNDRRGMLPVVALGPAAYLEWRPSSRVFLRAGGSLDVALVRNSIYVGSTEVWHAPALAAEVGISVGWGSP